MLEFLHDLQEHTHLSYTLHKIQERLWLCAPKFENVRNDYTRALI